MVNKLLANWLETRFKYIENFGDKTIRKVVYLTNSFQV